MAKSMKKLEQWRKRFPPAIAMLSLSMAGSAEEIYEFLQMMRKPGSLPMAPHPADRHWLKLYKKHHFIEDWVGKQFGFPLNGDFSGSKMMHAPAAVARMDPEDIKATLATIPKEAMQELAQSIMGMLDATTNLQFAMIQQPDMFVPENLSEDENRVMEKVVLGLHGQFMFRVWLPLWIEYRCMPCEIFRLARQGDINALEVLIRLDKAVLADPKIASHVNDAFFTKSRARFNRLAKAFQGASTAKITRGRVKGTIAAYIALIANQMNVTMRVPDLRKLFDALAQAQGALVDRDLGTPEAFAKSIQREKKFWTKGLLGHKTARHLSK